jgi:hypothetical protein
MSELDREFWMTIRAALIMFIRAIEKRYELKRHEFANPVGYNAEVKG